MGPVRSNPAPALAARVIQVSDTHLSHRRAYSVANVDAILDWVDAHRPDLVVHTGDIAADDPDDAAERAFAYRRLQERGLPLVVLPGNHDVGGFSEDLFTTARGAAFEAQWGADTFSVDLAGWRLVGANVYRLGEHRHDAWLAEALATEQPIALFLHQPLCLVHPDQADEGDWSVPMARRRHLLGLMAGRSIALVASGHLHRYRAGTLPAGAATVWCPPASFVGTEQDDGSTYVVGAVEHHLLVDGTVTHRLEVPPGTRPLRFGDFAPAGASTLRAAPLLPLPARR